MAPRLRIQAIDERQNSACLHRRELASLTWSFGYYVDNVAEGMTAPGAWYLNRKTGVPSTTLCPERT